VLAKQAISTGELLFKIPMEACFGAIDDTVSVEEIDSQLRVAKLMVNPATRSEWEPLISTLPNIENFDDLPWLWDDWETVLYGTELFAPVRSKLKRLHDEFDSLTDIEKSQFGGFKGFSKVCGVVMSHLNPFFCGSMVPFVYMLNSPNDLRPNVEFSFDGQNVVGVAVKDIGKGEELTQSYGEDIAAVDMIYRCGFFVPSLGNLKTNVISFDTNELGLNAARTEVLKDAGVVQESPWDGMSDVLTVELAPDLNGLTELLIALQVVSLDELSFSKVSESIKVGLESSCSEGLDDIDVSACILYSSLQNRPGDMKTAISKLKNGREKMKNADDLLWEILNPDFKFDDKEVLVQIVESRVSQLTAKRRLVPMINQLIEIEREIIKSLENSTIFN